MKIRSGFVSNSSSSSFVCDACFESYEGYDGDYGDIQHFECPNGHDVCSDCALDAKMIKLNTEQMRKILIEDNSDNAGYIKLLKKSSPEEIREIYLDNYDDDEAEEDENEDGDFPASRCSICQYRDLHEGDALKYLLIKCEYKNSDLLKELKSRFPDYADFKKFLKESK